MKRKDFTAVTRIVRLFTVLFLTTFAYSCSTFNEQPETVTQNAATMTTPGKRSVEQALANLQIVLDAIDGGTRSRTRSIKSIETVYCEEVLAGTRSETSKEGELVYIVNFENNDGYAVLGADEQLAPVITVTEKGSVSQKDLLINPDAMKDLEYEKLDQDSDPDYKDSPFYDAEDDDFYLGESDSTFANTMISNYLNNFLRNDGEFEYADDCPHNPEDGIKIRRETYATLIKTKWGQNQPFNNKIHIHDGKRRPTGCTVTAAVQIFANTKTPDMNIFGITDSLCTWERLEDIKFGPLFSETEQDYISTIFKAVADGVNVKYNFCGSGGTYAKPSSICKYMKNKAGYNNAQLHRKYNHDKILEMLKANKPVFIGAFDSENWEYGHAWIIDGAILIYGEFFKGDVCTDSFVQHRWFHCNWGWEGDCDGYYASEIFFTGDSNLRKGIDDDIDECYDYNIIPSTNDNKISFGDDSKSRYFYRYITY